MQIFVLSYSHTAADVIKIKPRYLAIHFAEQTQVSLTGYGKTKQVKVCAPQPSILLEFPQSVFFHPIYIGQPYPHPDTYQSRGSFRAGDLGSLFSPTLSCCLSICPLLLALPAPGYSGLE